ncbi:probable polygalacturonase At3g15720 [Impatiens glandulifera]|uniref:probable polygalacturonase At3g15720 n=1 Tax=Impatiens glandulifera TaxID=253017 RepID=UPI001FB0AF2C|nr:probable polygalacturonase At3g15720 [Impatiens glandulifera]
MRDNSSCKVVGIGTIKLKIFDGVVRRLNDVRHVPDLKKNLISLSSLDSKGYNYTLEGGVMKIIPYMKLCLLEYSMIEEGYSQITEIDFTGIFSPVVKHILIRVLLGIMAMHILELDQLDVKTLFLHGEMFNLFLSVFSVALFSLGFSLAATFDVTKFGAVGNGQHDDSEAFLKAWNSVCGSSIGGIMVVPVKTYFLAPLVFEGPCKSSSIQVQIDGTLVAPKTRSGWKRCEGDTWIMFSQVNGLHIHGNGKFDGQGLPWWNKLNFVYNHEVDNRRHGYLNIMQALRFSKCNNLQLNGLQHINPPKNHISINDCNNVQVSNIEIHAPEKSPNTDGIDISSSTNVKITDSIISSGDDCFAINSGCSDIFIENVKCGPGHGISVGSLGKDGSFATVEGVFVQNCTLIGTSNGVRIKTWEGGKGYAKNIRFENIILENVKNPIIIDQHYCNGRHDCKKQANGVQVSDVKYSNIKGTSATDQAIFFDCSDDVPCTDIVLDNIKISLDKTSGSTDSVSAMCKNVEGTITLTSPNVACLHTNHN